MAKDNTTKLQNYIKRLAGSAEEARELISQMVLIDWSAIYPTKQNVVVTTGKVDAGPFINVIAGTSTDLNVIPVKDEISLQIWDGGPIATMTSLTHQEVGQFQETEPSAKKPTGLGRPKPRRKQPVAPKPKYWEAKQRQLEAKEARLAKSPRVKELQAMPYVEYLKTDEWQKTRRRALASSGVKCQMCSATDKPLNVHHNTYERLGYERPSDLICLCIDCHAKHHDKLPKAY